MAGGYLKLWLNYCRVILSHNFLFFRGIIFSMEKSSLQEPNLKALLNSLSIRHLHTSMAYVNPKTSNSISIWFVALVPCSYVGGAVASWLVRSTPERVRVRALAGDIVLCSWARHLSLTVPLSIQVYKKGTGEFNAGSNTAMD